MSVGARPSSSSSRANVSSRTHRKACDEVADEPGDVVVEDPPVEGEEREDVGLGLGGEVRRALAEEVCAGGEGSQSRVTLYAVLTRSKEGRERNAPLVDAAWLMTGSCPIHFAKRWRVERPLMVAARSFLAEARSAQSSSREGEENERRQAAGRRSNPKEGGAGRCARRRRRGADSRGGELWRTDDGKDRKRAREERGGHSSVDQARPRAPSYAALEAVRAECTSRSTDGVLLLPGERPRPLPLARRGQDRPPPDPFVVARARRASRARLCEEQRRTSWRWERARRERGRRRSPEAAPTGRLRSFFRLSFRHPVALLALEQSRPAYECACWLC